MTDPRATRAPAHPLRRDLSVLGPATAARCARHLGTSQASCSFHLRQLARYGFVEEAPPGPDRRVSCSATAPATAPGFLSQAAG